MDIKWVEYEGILVTEGGDIAKCKPVKARKGNVNQIPVIKTDKAYKPLSRIVWEAYRGDIPTGNDIGHKDGNPLNNSLDNLCIIPTNIKMPIGDGYRVRGTFSTRLIREDLKQGISISEIAANHGCSYQHVWRLQKGK